MSPARAKPSAPRKIGAENDNRPGEALTANDDRRKAADPYALTRDQLKRLNKAERKLRSPDPTIKASGVSDIAKIQAERERRAEVARLDAERAEAVALAKGRGEVIDCPPSKPGQSAKPMRRVSGLDWLWSKGRLEGPQMKAGLRYGDDWRVGDVVSVKSCLGEGGGGDGMGAQERRYEAQRRLDRARKALGHPALIALCDQVCGEGRRLRSIARGNDAEAGRLEAVFKIGLDLLAAHYGSVR